MADAASPPTATLRACGDLRVSVRPRGTELFLGDQSPSRVDVELAKSDEHLRAFLGEDPKCEVLVASSVVPGPFGGIASDGAWSARLFEGPNDVIVIVFDASGTPRAARRVDVEPISYSVVLTRAEVLEDSAAIQLKTSTSGDGETDHGMELFGFVRGELRVLFRQAETLPQFALDKFEIVPIASKPPSFSVVLEAHSAFNAQADGTMSKPVSKKRIVRWDAKSNTFR